jgi:hypothetical protein
MNPFSKLKLLSSLKTSRSSTAAPPITTPPSGPTATSTATGPAATKTSATTQTLQIPEVGAAGQTGYSPNRPGLARALWAAHPNRTTRKLRKLLVSWEELGFFLSFSGTLPDVSPAADKSFLKVKVAVAKSVSFLKSIRGMGDIGKEASAKEKDFMEILERYPSLYAALDATDEDKRELFVAWHSLYLFLHRVLGADPYEACGESLPFPVRLHGESEGTRTNVRPFRVGKTA